MGICWFNSSTRSPGRAIDKAERVPDLGDLAFLYVCVSVGGGGGGSKETSTDVIPWGLLTLLF